MSESELSHRGLMKISNAKLDYIIELGKVERFIRKNGETPEVNRYMAQADEKYKKRVNQIYAEDKMLSLSKKGE